MKRMMIGLWRLGLLAGCLAWPALAQDAPGARELLDRTLARDYQDLELQIHLVKVSKKGNERPMDLAVKMRKDPEAAKTLAEFTAPLEVKGICALTWDYPEPDRPSDQWFRLSGLDYVKCVGRACQDMEERFGFSVQIFAINLDDATHQLLGEETVDGAACYKIQSTAKDQDNPDGARFLTWVDKTMLASRKIEIYDKTGKLIHASTFTEFKQIGDHWWETKGEVSDLATGKKLRFEISEAKVNTGIPEAVFQKPGKFTVEGDARP